MALLGPSLKSPVLKRFLTELRKYCSLRHVSCMTRTMKGHFICSNNLTPYETSDNGRFYICQRQLSVKHPKCCRKLVEQFQNGSLLLLKDCHLNTDKFSAVRQYCIACRQQNLSKLRQKSCYAQPCTVITRTVVTEKTIAAEKPGMTVTLATKKRVARKKAQEKEMVADHKNMAAYAVGSELYIDRLDLALKDQNLYKIVKLPVDITDTLMATAKYRVDGKAREIYFFEDGSVVCWNMPASERLEVVKFAQKYCENPHEIQLILDESEIMNVVTDSVTTLKGNTIHIREEDDTTLGTNKNILLEKFAFSNAVAQSVTMGMKEATLDAFVESIEPKTQDLRDGKDIHITRRALNKKIGEVFLLRHDINLRSDFLDTPDVYWEREELEILYKSMCTYLNIPKRTKVMNEKLNYCTQILELFSSQMNDERHVRLEWFIIALILVEVCFETLHYVERYLDKREIEERFTQEESILSDQPEKSVTLNNRTS